MVAAHDDARAEACRPTRERWDLARNGSISPSSWRPMSTIGVCKCGNGKIDTCTTLDRDCDGSNPHACDGLPIVQRSVTDACDGKDFGGSTCEKLGFAGGALSCTQECTVDTSACEWLPLHAKSAPLPPREVLVAMTANDDELLVITQPMQQTSPITARRYDRDLHVVAETTIAGSFDGLGALPHGFLVAVRDESTTPRKGAIYDVASSTPLFAFDDGRVVSMWTVRGQDKTLRDPIALLTYPTRGYQLLRVKRGARPVATTTMPSAPWNAEAVETSSGVVLPARLFDPLVRVRSDGSSAELALPEACPVHAIYTPGWLSWVGADLRATFAPVDESLHVRGTPSSFDTRTSAPVFVGDWLWLGGNDFVRRDAGASIVHLARGPVEPLMLTPFAGAVAIVWNRGPSAVTLVPFP